MKRFQLLICLWTITYCVTAQITAPKIENSLFWEVRGKNLKEPSYLFGTFHLLGNGFVDSLALVKEKFNTSKIVVGEMLMDSSMMMKLMAAAQLRGTTLDKLLSAEDYLLTAEWLKELSGYELRMFNTLNPITVQVFIMTLLQQKYFPIPNQQPMDMYFQQTGKKAGKKIIGLESLDVQIQAIYGQFSIERQATLLAKYVRKRDKAIEEVFTMNKEYRNANWDAFEHMMESQGYNPTETKVMLDDRNLNWVKQLPAIMEQGSAFIAVGAMHLTGETGLVLQLRKLGYTVVPVYLQQFRN
jgi:hypothetical protein